MPIDYVVTQDSNGILRAHLPAKASSPKPTVRTTVSLPAPVRWTLLRMAADNVLSPWTLLRMALQDGYAAREGEARPDQDRLTSLLLLADPPRNLDPGNAAFPVQLPIWLNRGLGSSAHGRRMRAMELLSLSALGPCLAQHQD